MQAAGDIDVERASTNSIIYYGYNKEVMYNLQGCRYLHCTSTRICQHSTAQSTARWPLPAAAEQENGDREQQKDPGGP
jgi:hypothetical protein